MINPSDIPGPFGRSRKTSIGSQSDGKLIAGRFKQLSKQEDPFLPLADLLGTTFYAEDTRVPASKTTNGTTTETVKNVFLLRISSSLLEENHAANTTLQNIAQISNQQLFSGLLPVLAYNLETDNKNDSKPYIAWQDKAHQKLSEWTHNQLNPTSNYGDIIRKLIKILSEVCQKSNLRPIVLPKTISIYSVTSDKSDELDVELIDAGLIAAFIGVDKYISQIKPQESIFFAPELRQAKTPITEQSYVFTLAALYLFLLGAPSPGAESIDKMATLPDPLRLVLRKAIGPLSERYHSLLEFESALFDAAYQSEQAQSSGTASILARKAGVRDLRISWRKPDDTAPQSSTFYSQFIMIGTDSRNDICLDNNGELIRQRHACIWQGEEGFVTLTEVIDRKLFDQSAPTLLNGTPLSPNFAALIDESSHIQISDYLIRLLPPVDKVTQGQDKRYAEIRLEQTKITVKAGESLRIPITYFYRDRQVEELLPILDGIPNNWVVAPLSYVRFLQSESAEGELAIHLPTTTQSKARTYELILRLISTNLHVQVAARPIWITVLPEYGFESWAEPGMVKAGRPFQLFINNLGNLTQTFAIRCADLEKAMRFDPPIAQIVVRPNDTGVVIFEGIPYERHWLGNPRRHQATVTISPLGGGTPQSELVQIVSRALIPGWLLSFLTAILALILLTGMMLFKPVFTMQIPDSPGKAIEGQAPLLLQWRGQNTCFYTVTDNGITTRWLQRSITAINTYTVTAPFAGQRIEITPRNCFFAAGTSWIVDVGNAPPTPAPTPLPPGMALFKANVPVVLIGQEGDLCFGWETNPPLGAKVDKYQITPLIGEIEASQKQICRSIQSLFPQANLQPPDYAVAVQFSISSLLGEQSSLPLTISIQVYDPVCRVKDSVAVSYLWEGPGANFPMRATLHASQPLLVLASPFYPIDRPGEGWLKVSVMSGDPRPGWVDLGTMDCGAISNLINGLSPAEIPPAPPPTLTPTSEPTTTPEPTATPIPGPAIKVNVEPKIINAGGCVLVSWDIQNVKQIFLNGVGQVGNGEIQDCPTATKDYDWHIKVDDNNYVDRKLTVIVNGSSDPGNPPPPVQQ